MTGEEHHVDLPPTTGKRQKNLMAAMILIALGTGLGGAGVVLFTAPATKKEETGTRVPEYQLVEHEDIMKFLVNPQTQRGGRITARIGFRFVYKRDKHKAKKTLKSIKDYWNKAYSRCLMVISSQDVKFLSTAEGKQALRRMLVGELTLSLFPPPDKIAIVEDILWTEYFLQ